MASPQKENGYTAIANELFEKLGSFHFLGSELSIIVCVIRKTYGFHKKEDFISLTQFEEFTKLSRPTVVSCIKNLVENNVLNKKGSVFSLNKDWEKWGSKACLTSKACFTRTSKHRFTKTSKACFTHKRNKEIKEISTTEVVRTLKVNKTIMRKNSFNYNEGNMSDSYEDVIDLESNTFIVEKKKGNAKIEELVKWAENRRGSKFLSRPKQYKFIQRLKDSEQPITPEDIKVRWIELESDPYWSKNGFDFGAVFSSFDKKPLK